MKVAQIPQGNGARVCLDGDLRIGKGEVVGNRPKNGFELARRQKRGRAAAEEHRVQGQLLWGIFPGKGDLAAKRLHISRDGFLLPGVGIEIAIRAAVAAEWDMDIKGVIMHNRLNLTTD